ncbi:MAG TPA: hypothetical protein VIV60_31850 [Polyangiaceae bacterium]
MLFLLSAACSGSLDAGWDKPRGQLPVDNRNPIVLCNDGVYDNWAGEYAALFASSGTLSLVGIVVATGSNENKNLDDNMTGWRQMVVAARSSGLQNIPDPMASSGSVLVRPSDGNIDSTATNRSEGAHFILDTAARLSQPYRPLVVVTGGRLTDVADAYLMDHTLPERVVVVSSLGTTTASGAVMGPPNGEMDKWADVIVAQKFRYVQISSFYDQKTDVPDSLPAQLPQNSFTTWIAAKQAKVYDDLLAADQVAVVALAVPEFVSTVSRAALSNTNTDSVPTLASDASGPAWLVSQVSGAVATARLWNMLLDPAVYHGQ